jgi:hypothetical protein
MSVEELYYKLPAYYKRNVEPPSLDAESQLKTRLKLMNLKKKNTPDEPDCLFLSAAKFIPSSDTTKVRAQEIRRKSLQWIQTHQLYDFVRFRLAMTLMFTLL